MSRKSIPDPLIVSLSEMQTAQQPIKPVVSQLVDRRQQRVEAFLQARSLSASSQKAYCQDLQRFLDWTEVEWEEVTPRQMARFKTYLTQEKQLAAATVNRVLRTLKNFYSWLVESDPLLKNPTTALLLLKLEPARTQDLSAQEVQRIYAIASESTFPERDVALISVLLHGLRAEEASSLNLEDYDGSRLQIRSAKGDRPAWVPLNAQAQETIETYLAWRQQSEPLTGESPFFLSYSRRSRGQRLSYWGIREVVERIAEATGIALHTHRFRHTFAADLMTKGIDAHQIIAMTRHKSIQSCRRYTKSSSDEVTNS